MLHAMRDRATTRLRGAASVAVPALLIVFLCGSLASAQETQPPLEVERALGCKLVETLPAGVPLFAPPPPDRPLRASVDHSGGMPPVGNQGIQGSCVGWGTGYACKSFLEGQDHGWDMSPSDHWASPAFVYNQINGGVDGGAFISDANWLVTKRGCCMWPDMPYDEYDYTTWPSQQAAEKALKYRSESYQSIDRTDLTTIKQALLGDGLVLPFGIRVDYNFYYNLIGPDTNYVWYPEGSSMGGHCICIVGYDDDKDDGQGHIGAFKIINSWDTTWGLNGYCWIAYDAMSTSYVNEVYRQVDRIGHTVTAKVRFTVSHGARGHVAVTVGAGPTDSPVWSDTFYSTSMTMNLYGYDEGDNIASVVDVTDGEAYLNGDYHWWIKFSDDEFDSYAGQVTECQLEYNSQTYPGIPLPADAPDLGDLLLRFSGVGESVNMTMAVDPAGTGTTSPAAGAAHEVPKDEWVSIQATGLSGCSFGNWTATAGATIESSSAAGTRVMLSADATVTAHFGAPTEIRMVGWGMNGWGQIGDGTTTRRTSPVAIEDVSAPSQVAGGKYHSLALDGNGAVWAWGGNSDGQLGYGGTGGYSQTPQTVPGLDNVIFVAAGARHSLAVVDDDQDGDGTVWAWGNNDSGQLGNGEHTSSTSPVQVVVPQRDADGKILRDPSTGDPLTDPLDEVTQVAAGEYHSLALRKDGTVWAWGSNAWGQLGDNRNTVVDVLDIAGVPDVKQYSYDGCAYPVQVADPADAGGVLKGVQQITAGSFHSLALDNNGDVWAWGSNTWGQLGNGEKADSWYAVELSGISSVAQVAAGSWHSIAVKTTGSVHAWGGNWWGQLGDGTDINASRPVAVTGLTGTFTGVGAGENHSVALRNTGTVYAWGRNRHGQLGDGTIIDRMTPAQVSGLTEVTSVSPSGAWHVLALGSRPFEPPSRPATAGIIWSAGENAEGELGQGDTNPYTSFTTTSVEQMCMIDAGDYHALALKNDGTVYSCGDNQYGQLGMGNDTDLHVFTKVTNADITSVVSVAVGANHSLVLKSNGTVWACGLNSNGQLGMGDDTNLNDFADVANLERIVAIAAGGAHSLAVKDDGTLWVCGDNQYGQLGMGDDTERQSFEQVPNLYGVSDVSVGAAHSVVLLADGTVLTCGRNSDGQLGQGGTTDLDEFTLVSGLSSIQAISAGGYHTLALTSGGVIYGCGRNSSGELGLGNYDQQNSFEQVTGVTDVVSIAAARGAHSLAAQADGTLLVTGLNGDGQLGLGDTTPRNVFTPVVAITENAVGIAGGATSSYTLIRPLGSWTFIVYLDADNNLESAGLQDFLEMAQVGSDDEISIVVLFDRLPGYTSDFGDWSDTRRGLIQQGDLPDTSWGTSVGEKNMGDGATLIEFTEWAMQTYPAQNYALILWNHGAGWASGMAQAVGVALSPEQQAALAQKTGDASAAIPPVFARPLSPVISGAVCWDETSGNDCLTMAELKASLATIEANAAEPDLIGFDACLMAMVEVAYQIRDHGNVMVGSEASEPGAGWPYQTILQDLVDDSNMTAEELGTAIVNRYYESYGDDYTQSAVRFSETAAAAAEISTFAQVLRTSWDTDHQAVKDAATDVMTQLDATFIHEQHGDDYAGSHGLAIYFPESDAVFDPDYRPGVLDFPEDTQWDEFLEDFHSDMLDSWIALARYASQSYDDPSHVDLYDFCYKLVHGTGQTDYYTESLVTHAFVGGGTAQEDWITGEYADNQAWEYTLPFNFPFFREDRNTVWVSTNGALDFGTGYVSCVNSVSGLIENERIAVMWTDLVMKEIYIHQPTTDSVCFRWEGWLFGEDYPDADITVNFEVVLYQDGRIQFNYGANPNPITGWSGPPTIGLSKGDGINFYLSEYNGQTDLNEVQSDLWTPYTVGGEPGRAWATGANSVGQLGLGDWTSPREAFEEVFPPQDVVLMDGGLWHSAVLKQDGTVWTCGANNDGQLGHGDTNNRNTFAEVSGLPTITSIAAGGQHTVALDTAGNVWVCGLNDYGQLGLGDHGAGTERESFTQVASLSQVAAIYAGYKQTFALKSDGTLWATGYNVHGGLGLGNEVDRDSFEQVTGVTDIKAIAVGVTHTYLLQNSGALLACGENSHGQLGQGDTTHLSTFTPVPGLVNITAVAAGQQFGIALEGDGTIASVGWNNHGQLGLDDTNDRHTFVPVLADPDNPPDELDGISAVAVALHGGWHSLILKTDGTVMGAGHNENGQLGLGDTTDRYEFTSVSGLSNVIAIAGGGWHSLALVGEGAGGTAVSPRTDGRVEEADPDAQYTTPSYEELMGFLVPAERDAFDGVAKGGTPTRAQAAEVCDGIVDNRDNSSAKRFRRLSGEWRTSALAEGYYGKDYCYARARDRAENSRARFLCTTLPAGRYDVYACWSSRSDRARNVAYEIHHADGVATVHVDQTVNGGRWNRIGAFRFNGGSHVVEIHNGLSKPGSFVCADAVRFMPAGSPLEAVRLPLAVELPPIGEQAQPAGRRRKAAAKNPALLELLSPSDPAVRVTPGGSFPIRWKSDGLPSFAPVEIALYRAGERVVTLMPATPNDGRWTWLVGLAIRGDAYTVRISAVGFSEELFDESKRPFIIALPGEW